MGLKTIEFKMPKIIGANIHVCMHVWNLLHIDKKNFQDISKVCNGKRRIIIGSGKNIS